MQQPFDHLPLREWFVLISPGSLRPLHLGVYQKIDLNRATARVAYWAAPVGIVRVDPEEMVCAISETKAAAIRKRA